MPWDLKAKISWNQLQFVSPCRITTLTRKSLMLSDLILRTTWRQSRGISLSSLCLKLAQALAVQDEGTNGRTSKFSPLEARILAWNSSLGVADIPKPPVKSSGCRPTSYLWQIHIQRDLLRFGARCCPFDLFLIVNLATGFATRRGATRGCPGPGSIEDKDKHQGTMCPFSCLGIMRQDCGLWARCLHQLWWRRYLSTQQTLWKLVILAVIDLESLIYMYFTIYNIFVANLITVPPSPTTSYQVKHLATFPGGGRGQSCCHCTWICHAKGKESGAGSLGKTGTAQHGSTRIGNCSRPAPWMAARAVFASKVSSILVKMIYIYIYI